MKTNGSFCFSRKKSKEAPKIHTFGHKLHQALRRTFRSTAPRARRQGPHLSKADLAASLFMAPQVVSAAPRGHAPRRRRQLAYANQLRGPDIFRVR